MSNVGETILQAKLTPACARNQVIVYDGFEPLMHKNWYGQSDVEPGHVKHLGFASGYGHLTYRPTGGQPIPADRAVRVDVLKVN